MRNVLVGLTPKSLIGKSIFNMPNYLDYGFITYKWNARFLLLTCLPPRYSVYNFNLSSFLLKVSKTKLAQTKEQVFSNFTAMVHIPWCPYSLEGKQVPASVGLGSRQEESHCPALGKQIPVCAKPQAREREHTFDTNIYPGAKWGDKSSTSLDTNGAVTWNSHYAS